MRPDRGYLLDQAMVVSASIAMFAVIPGLIDPRYLEHLFPPIAFILAAHRWMTKFERLTLLIP